MRKIGINMRVNALQSLADFERYIKTMTELGFSTTFSGMTELQLQLDIANLLSKYGVEYETLHAPSAHINDMWLPGEEGDNKLKQLCACADHARAAGAGIIVVHLSSGDAAPPVTDIGRARFTALIEHAAKQNVYIAFENQRKLSNIAWAFENFSAEDHVGFCWDCGHEAVFAHGREYMPLFGNRLICTHIHDNFGVFQQDKHMLPFDGNYNFARFAQHIQASGYTGSLMLEVNPLKHEMYSAMPEEEYLQRAAAAIKRVRNLVDVPQAQ